MNFPILIIERISVEIPLAEIARLVQDMKKKYDMSDFSNVPVEQLIQEAIDQNVIDPINGREWRFYTPSMDDIGDAEGEELEDIEYYPHTVREVLDRLEYYMERDEKSGRYVKLVKSKTGEWAAI